MCAQLLHSADQSPVTNRAKNHGVSERAIYTAVVEWTRRCLATDVVGGIRSNRVIDVLARSECVSTE